MNRFQKGEKKVFKKQRFHKGDKNLKMNQLWY